MTHMDGERVSLLLLGSQPLRYTWSIRHRVHQWCNDRSADTDSRNQTSVATTMGMGYSVPRV